MPTRSTQDPSDRSAQPSPRGGASWVMAVLEVFATLDPRTHPDGLGVSEVARALGRDKSVVSRQLQRLREAGLITRDQAGRHELSWRLFTVVGRAGNHRLTRVSSPFLIRLAASVRERTYLTVLSDNEVLTLQSESSRRAIEAVNWVGRTVPVRCTSSGMALVIDHDEDHLLDIIRRHEPDLTSREAVEFVRRVEQARERGYAVADGVFDPDLTGLGAPVRDLAGQVVAAVNISGPSARVRPHLKTFAGELLTATRALERALYCDDSSAPTRPVAPAHHDTHDPMP